MGSASGASVHDRPGHRPRAGTPKTTNASAAPMDQRISGAPHQGESRHEQRQERQVRFHVRTVPDRGGACIIRRG